MAASHWSSSSPVFQVACVRWIFQPLSLHWSSSHVQLETWLPLDLETWLSELLCRHPSASSSPLLFVFLSPATWPWSISLLRVKDCCLLFKGLVNRSVKIGSCCRSRGTVKRVWVVRSKGSVSFGRSKYGYDKQVNSSCRQVRQSILIRWMC